MGTPVELIKEELLSDNWYILKKITYRYRTRAGEWKILSREAYDRGNGAVILLFNANENKVILTRQFRLPTYINGNNDGWLMEACAGLLDNDTPEVAIKRETEEETGLRIQHVDKTEVFTSFGGGGVCNLLNLSARERCFDCSLYSCSDFFSKN